MYRSREAALIQGAVAVLFPIGVSLPALLASTSGPDTMSPGMRVFLIALGVVGSAVTLRSALCAIHVESAGIRVVNPWSSRRIKWSEIDEFTLARSEILPRNCVIRLTDGSTQGVWAISARNPLVAKHDTAAEGLVRELNERLRRERGDNASLPRETSSTSKASVTSEPDRTTPQPDNSSPATRPWP